MSMKKNILRAAAVCAAGALAFTTVSQVVSEAEKSSEKESLLKEASIQVSRKDIDKDETVYVMCDADGDAYDVIVSDHLYNRDGADVIEDVSTLSDIKNTDGDETYTQSGDKLTWQAGGNDIYYQGKTDEEIPVSVKATYFLDGKEISPSELAGKSGHVKIRFDYENNTSKREKVKDEEIDTVVPFAAVTALVLGDDFTNVSAVNGRVVENGMTRVAMGYTLPGIREALSAEDSETLGDDLMPEYFEVEADTEDFSLQSAMTVVVDASSTLTASSNDSIEDLSDDMDELSKGSDDLKAGAGELADGTGTLNDAAAKLAGGADELSEGIADYTGGADKLASGIGALSKGSGKLSAALPTLTEKINALADGTAQLAEGAKALSAGYDGDGTEENPGLVAGAKSLEKGASDVADGAAALDEAISTLSDKIGASVGQIASGFSEGAAAQISATIDASLNTKSILGLLRSAGILGASDKITAANLDNVTAAVEKNKTALIGGLTASGLSESDATAKYYDLRDGLHQVQAAGKALAAAGASLSSQIESSMSDTDSEGLAALKAGSEKLATGAAAVAKGAQSISAGIDKEAQGTKKLSRGADKLNAGVSGSTNTQGLSDLADGLVAMASGIDQLKSGSDKLISNDKKLLGGAGDLAEGAKALSDGAKKLDDGAGELYDGVVRLDEEGIEKITDAFSGDIRPLARKLRAMIDAGKQYESFSGKSDDMTGLVKFVYRMDSISGE